MNVSNGNEVSSRKAKPSETVGNALGPSAIIAVVNQVIGLLVLNLFITNSTGKLITGIASSVVSLGFLIYGAVRSHAHARVVSEAEVAKLYAQPVDVPVAKAVDTPVS